MEQHDIKKLLLQQGAELFERYEVAFAYLFGSANSGHFRPQSDIDIAARFKAGHSSHDLLRLSALLELALKKLLRRKVDLVILNLAPPLLRYEVVKNGAVLFSCDEEQRALFQIRAYRDYDDFCHAQNFYIQTMQERLLGSKP